MGEEVTPQQRAVLEQFDQKRSKKQKEAKGRKASRLTGCARTSPAGELEFLEREMTQRSVALEEHKRVLQQMSGLDASRRALQNVAGVLVPRTVGDATAELQTRVQVISSQLSDLASQHKAKADALRAFMAEHNLRITADPQFSAVQRDLASAPS